LSCSCVPWGKTGIALHGILCAKYIACAVEAGCDFFLTTDKGIPNKKIAGIELVNPIDYIRRQEDAV